MSNTIKMRGVTKSFFCQDHVIPVLKDVNLDLTPGEIVVIKGLKDNSKDTLLNVLGLLDKPTTGEFIWNNENIGDFSDKEIKEMRNKNVGLMMKAINLIDKMTVEENVMLPTFSNIDISNEERIENTKKSLELLNLLEIKDSLISEINELDRVKAIIARGLVNNPSLIIIDDVFEYLNDEEKHIVSNIIDIIATGKKSIVIISNNTNRVSDKTYNFENGIIEFI